MSAREKCGAFLRKRHAYRGGSVLCSRAATHDVVAIGPAFQRVMHGRYCLPHAKRLASRFADRNGWSVDVEWVDP